MPHDDIPNMLGRGETASSVSQLRSIFARTFGSFCVTSWIQEVARTSLVCFSRSLRLAQKIVRSETHFQTFEVRTFKRLTIVHDVAVLSGTKYGLRQTRGKFGLGAKMVSAGRHFWTQQRTKAAPEDHADLFRRNTLPLNKGSHAFQTLGHLGRLHGTLRVRCGVPFILLD